MAERAAVDVAGAEVGPEVQGARWRIDLALLDRERVLRGWTRADLARRAHVDPGTLSDMFRCKRRPVLGTVQAIVTALGLTLGQVIVFEQDRQGATWLAA
jgi:transcriptional regulator with XRE-family HTH domain